MIVFVNASRLYLKAKQGSTDKEPMSSSNGKEIDAKAGSFKRFAKY